MIYMRTNTAADYALLYFGIFIYSLSAVMNKAASQVPTLSAKFVIFYGCSLLILGVYAVLWQQILKRFSLVTAYSRRPMSMLFGMLWGWVIFKEKVTLQMVAGIVIILIGIRIGADKDAI